MTFTGISAARKRLARLAAGLRDAASGAVLARAAAKVGAQLAAVAEQKTSAHQLSGNARGSIVLTVGGGHVELTTARYLSYHSWWPFRRGMPPFVVKRAVIIFARELLVALGGEVGALGEEAGAVVEEAEEGARKSAAKNALRKLRPRRGR